RSRVPRSIRCDVGDARSPSRDAKRSIPSSNSHLDRVEVSFRFCLPVVSPVGRPQSLAIEPRWRNPHDDPARRFASRSACERAVKRSILLIAAIALAGCSEGVLAPQGPIAAAERQIMFNATGIMLAIVIPTMLATLGIALWFRASNTRARYRPDFEYSSRLEVLVWSIPAMTVLLVGSVAWVGAHDLDPRKGLTSATPPIHVQVISLDWKWLFIYPDQGIGAVNQLTVPVGTPIDFELTSAGVMNSFFIPQLGTMIYTMPGMVTRLQ